MRINRLLPFLQILFLVQICNAQIGFSDWETKYFSTNATPEQKDFLKKVVFPRNIHFPRIKPYKYGFDNMHCWNIYLKKCFAAFFTETKSYDFNRTASLTYGILNIGNYDTYNFHSQLKSSISDTGWVELVYAALIPFFKESWGLLDPKSRYVYNEIARHTESYLNNFNYDEEKEYLEKLDSDLKPDNFIDFSPNSLSKNEYRKAEAFVFRRIDEAKAEKGNWTIPWIRKMIIRAKQDLGID